MEQQNDDDFNVDMAEIKKVLEDANMAEPNMPKDLMISYYKALTNSKNTASEEDEIRRLNETLEEPKELPLDNVENVVEITPDENKEKPFKPKTWSSQKKFPVEGAFEHNNNENVEESVPEETINDTPKDATKITFGFNEMAKSSENTLTIINHELKFISIQNSQKFLNAGTALKVKMLYAYHTKMNKLKMDLARQSFFPAPLPRITSTTETFPNFSDMNSQDTYICRSGRQTKRKIYNYDDDEDSLDGTNNKKVKNNEEQEWLSKPTQTKNSPRTQKKEVNKTNNAEANKTELEIEDGSKEKKKEIKTPVSKRLSNAEIMRRSSLFEIPKRRCEALFEKLKEEEEIRLREERDRELFNKTLERLDEENDVAAINEDVITVEDDRIVVAPRIPNRKFVNRKRTNPEGLAPLNIKVNQKKEPLAEQNGSNQDRELSVSIAQVKKRPAIRHKPTVDPIDSSPSTSRATKPAANRVPCPICSGLFDEDKIEGHAATCGDDPVVQSNSKMSRITCNVCDKVVDFDTDYEVHVKACIAKKRQAGL